MADKGRKPKRFYQDASVDAVDVVGGGFAVLLDGRGIKTPGRAPLSLPTRALAEAVAEEWQAQEDEIDLEAMWLTKLANTALDRVGPRRGEIEAEILNFAGTDLLCYRAEYPEALRKLQAEKWNPLLDWAATRFGARLAVTEGILPVAQDDAALAQLADAIDAVAVFPLTGLHNAVSLMGSLVLGLALLERQIDGEAGFELAHLDERWQESQWGQDSEALERLTRRRAELERTVVFLGLAAPARS